MQAAAKEAALVEAHASAAAELKATHEAEASAKAAEFAAAMGALEAKVCRRSKGSLRKYLAPLHWTPPLVRLVESGAPLYCLLMKVSEAEAKLAALDAEWTAKSEGLLAAAAVEAAASEAAAVDREKAASAALIAGAETARDEAKEQYLAEYTKRKVRNKWGRRKNTTVPTYLIEAYSFFLKSVCVGGVVPLTLPHLLASCICVRSARA